MGFLLSFPLTIVMFLMPGALAVNIAGQAVPAVALLSIATAFLTSLWMGPTYAALARLVPADIRGQAIGLLSVVINIMGSVLGPPIAGGVSDLLTAQFGAEALRYSLLTMSSLIIVGGLVFWRASAHYRREIIEE